METANKSQSQRIKDALSIIASDVTADDKTACVKELPITQPTLWRYLNGEIKDLDKAIQILIFFKQRISKREDALQKAVA